MGMLWLVWVVWISCVTSSDDDYFFEDGLNVLETAILNFETRAINPVALYTTADTPTLDCRFEGCEKLPIREIEGQFSLHGRLLVRMQHRRTLRKTTVPSSAFQVAPGVLVTAKHAIKVPEWTTIDMWYTTRVYFTPEDLDLAIGTKDVVKVTSIPQSKSVREHLVSLKIDLEDIVPGTEKFASPTEWDYMFDFAFLKLPDNYKISEFLIPRTAPLCEQCDIFCTGYPKRPNDFDSEYKYLQLAYFKLIGRPFTLADLETLFRNFHRKCVSPGRINSTDPTRFVAHTATTSRGYSGGACQDPKHPNEFVGIHVGGEGNDNLFIATDHPAFVLEYARVVASLWEKSTVPQGVSAYLDQHRELLEKFPDHHLDEF